MIAQLYDDKRIIVKGDDVEFLKELKERLDGDKVRGKNQFIAPIKSSPKLFKFRDRIMWDGVARNAAIKISLDITDRKKKIAEIRCQYGGKIDFDYNCRGKYSPLEHQKIMYSIMMASDVSAILADPGTCKTGPYLWAIDERIKRGDVKKCLIITLSNLKRNVLEEAAKQIPGRNLVVLDERERSNKILNKKYKVLSKNRDYDIYISNYESMFTHEKLFDEDYFQMVVLDEAHRIGSPQSRQTKAIINKFEYIKYKAIVTGSLHANHLMSFYMPFRFLGPDTLPFANFYECRRNFMYTVDPEGRIWKDLPGSQDKVKKIVSNISVVFKKEDCLDLPDLIQKTLYCNMGKSQEAIYKSMKKDLVATIANMCEKCSKSDQCDGMCDDQVAAKNALVLSKKLHQIASGFYINTMSDVDVETGKIINTSSVIKLDENPKLELLINAISDIPKDKKIIIWTNYIYLIDAIVNKIGGKFGSDRVMTCYKDQNAFKQVEEFKLNNKRFMVANPSKMGVGLNIQFSSYQIFFSNSYSWIQRDQAISRQHRKGQEEKVTVIDLVTSNTVDEIIIKALLRKENLSISLSELARVV